MPEDMLSIRRPEAGLGDLVVAAVRDAIADGALAPGQRLTERELMERTGVSRTSIREALSQLRRMGLIEERPRGGIRVAVLDRSAIEQIYEVRTAIEPMVAELFTLRATDSEVAELIDAYGYNADGPDSPGEVPDLSQPGRAEELLFRGARNPLLKEIIEPFHARIRSVRRLSLTMPGRYAAAVAENREIVDAIRRREPEEAAKAVRRHIAEAQRAALTALDGINDQVKDATPAIR
jgi:DNA-binding GntR family transcriptional regulator